MKRREVITIAVSVLIVLLLFAALKLSGNDAAPPPPGQPFAETGDLLTDEATPSSRESQSPPLADATGLELAGLSLPIGFASEKRSAQALPDTKREKYNLYSLKSKNPWWRKSNVSRGSFSLGRFRLGVNVIPAMLQTSKDAMLRSFRSAGPVKFKETTVPYAHGGLKGDRTFLQNIESRAGLPKDHVLIYSLYANKSIWFITFFYSDMEELTTFSEEFMSGVELSAPSESAESSASTAKQTAAEPPVAESPSEAPSESPNSLSDADVERLLKVAVDYDSLEERDAIFYQGNKPYSGWGKEMYDSDQAFRLAEIKDGKPNGLMIEWHENGQKAGEGTLKDGEPHGPFLRWHENGQKMFEGTYKDGNQDGLLTGWYENGQKAEETTFKDTYPHGLWIRWHKNGQKQSETIWENAQKISVKYWNSKGEEVESREESEK